MRTALGALGLSSLLSLGACDTSVDPAAPVDGGPDLASADGKADGPGPRQERFTVAFVAEQGPRFRVASTPVVERRGAVTLEVATRVTIEVDAGGPAAPTVEAVLLHYCRAMGSPWSPPRMQTRALACEGLGAERRCRASFDDLELRQTGSGYGDFECRQELAVVIDDRWLDVPGSEPEADAHNFGLVLGPGIRFVSSQGHRLAVDYTLARAASGSATTVTAEPLVVSVARPQGARADMEAVLLDYCRAAGSPWSLTATTRAALVCADDDGACSAAFGRVAVARTGTGVADYACRQELAVVIDGVWQEVPGAPGEHNFQLVVE